MKEFLQKEQEEFRKAFPAFKNRAFTEDTVQVILDWISAHDKRLLEKVGENVIGMIVKNSTGFDTIGNKRIWHLDVDAFEKELEINST